MSHFETKLASLRASPFATVPLLVGALFFTRPAMASPEFPAELRDAAGLDCTPTCSTCHEQDPGTSGTATKPFALDMVEAGLVAGDPDTVAPAFEELQQAGNGDSETGLGGASGESFECQAEVHYGCTVARTRPDGTRFLWPLLLSLAGLTGLGLRRAARLARQP